MLRRRGLLQSGAAISDPNDGRDDGDEAWPLTKGYLAGLFISLAQTRRSRIIAEKKKESRNLQWLITSITGAAEAAAPDPAPARDSQSSPTPPGLEPRYQILLTDRDAPGGSEDSVQLYTAQVSDFLLEHFRTPTQLPKNAPLERDSPHLMRINRSVIPLKPRRSFQRRLRAAIMHDANSTIGGFLSDLN